MPHLFRLAVSLAVLAVVAGCGLRGPVSRPPATTPGTETSAPRPLRIVVIDLTRAMRVHPRWPETLALDRQISALDARIAAFVANRSAAVQLNLPRVDLTPEVRAAANRMRPELMQEAEAVKAAARKDLEAYVASVRADQQKKMDAKRTALEADLAKGAQSKQQELDKDTQAFQDQTMAAYRLPLLNIKLKLETVQQAPKGEADKLQAQQQALTKERDDKIVAHEKANQQALADFQKEQIAASNAQLKAYEDELTKEGQQRVNNRAAQLTADVQAKLRGMQGDFNRRLRDQQAAIVSSAQQVQTREVERAKAQAEQQVQGDTAKLRALQDELQAAQRARFRLYDAILADVRLEAAALAQEKGWDVVLTRAVAAPGAVDETDELIARIRR